MKNFRLMTALLSVISACSLIAGCSGGTPSATESPSAADGPAAAPPADAASPGSLAVNKEGFPIVNEPVTLKIFGQQGPVQSEWPQMDLFTAYQEMTGIQLDFDIVPSQGYDEKKSLLFASNDYPDIFVRAFLSNTDIVKYGGSGVLAPLEGLLADYAPNYSAHMQEYPAMAGRITAPDGHIYALSDVVTLTAARDDKYWINQGWLEKVGKEIPTTFDELEQVLIAFRDGDPNGNGQSDEIPMGVADLQGLINNLCGCWGLQRQFGQNLNVVDGKVSTWLTSDSLKDLLQWINKMYQEKLIDPEIFTQDYAKYAAKMAGLNMGFFFNQADDTFDSTNYVGIAPFQGKSDTLVANSSPVARGNGVFAVSTACKYPEAALRWVDYFYGDEGSIFMRFGVEGKTWKMGEDGKPQYMDGILNSSDGSGTAIGRFTIWPGGGAPQWINEKNSIAIASPNTVAAQEALDPYILENIYPEPLFDQATNDRLMILQNDIMKYMKESTAKFANGDLSFDKWDTYVQTLEKMGIDEWVSIYQKALDSMK